MKTQGASKGCPSCNRQQQQINLPEQIQRTESNLEKMKAAYQMQLQQQAGGVKA